MVFELGDYQLEIDVEKTRAFYETADTITDGCTCDGCRNYALAVDGFPQSVKEFFAMLGVDLQKAAEIIPWCAEDDGKALFYGGFYHICGRIRNHVDCWKDNGAMSGNMYVIAAGYAVGFTENVSLLEANFPTPVLQMEIDFHHVPWLSEQKNPY